MARGIDWPQTNAEMGPPQGMDETQVNSLRVFQNREYCVSAWRLSDEEIAEIVRTKTVFLAVMMGGRMPPVYIGSKADVRDLVADAGPWKEDRHLDQTGLSFWFPRLEAAGIPVPKTILVNMPVEVQRAIGHIFNGEEGPPLSAPESVGFFEMLGAAGRAVGFPCFLRTDHGSGKHQWRNTCAVQDPAAMRAHVMAIAEWSECAGIIGLPWDRWAVREMLPTIPLGYCRAYGDMPICREFRVFVRGPKLLCRHAYWPRASIEEGAADFLPGRSYEDLVALSPEEAAKVDQLAQWVGAVLDTYPEKAWSVDIIETERGWVVTDLAEAEKSFHWPGCEHNDHRSPAEKLRDGLKDMKLV